jgi:hypothetical protein
MTLARRRFLSLAGGAVAAPILARSARPQAYPTRPVRMIVPLAAGGPTDVFARLIAQKLSDSTGKQFYVENIPGAGGSWRRSVFNRSEIRPKSLPLKSAPTSPNGQNSFARRASGRSKAASAFL